jgi:phage terminase large subunit
MQNKADIEVLRAFYPLHQPATHKAVYGGRASGKSHWAATYCILQGTLGPRRILCCREIQHTLRDSSKQLIWDKVKELGLEDFYVSTEQEIRGKNGTVFWFAGLRTHSTGSAAENLKSKEGVDLVWIEEAQMVSQTSIDLLIPTIRREGAEFLWTWNPRFAKDPVDKMFRGGNAPPNAIVLKVNYTENPLLPTIIHENVEWLRLRDYDKFRHVYLGEYQERSEAQVFKNWKIGSVELPEGVSPYSELTGAGVIQRWCGCTRTPCSLHRGAGLRSYREAASQTAGSAQTCGATCG